MDCRHRESPILSNWILPLSAGDKLDGCFGDDCTFRAADPPAGFGVGITGRTKPGNAEGQDETGLHLDPTAAPAEHGVERQGETLMTAREAGTPTRLVRSNPLLGSALIVEDIFLLLAPC